MDHVTKIEQALERFDTAIKQLEVSMAAYHSRGSDLEKVRGEADALKAERKKIMAELDEVRARADELSEANRQAVKRISMAMQRIESVAR